MEDLFEPWKGNGYELGEEGWFDREFDRALLDLDPKASVGMCAMSRYGSNIGDALGWDPFEVRYDEHRLRVFREFVRLRFNSVREPDPILVFIKPEPHTRKKIAEGRLRLISAVSLIDTMVDRICFGWLQRAVMSSVGATPALVGWSPYHGGYRFLTSRFRRALCVDKSSWDWTVQGWLLKLVRELLKRLLVGAPDWWLTWVDERWEALFKDAVFGFRSGELIRQPGWGVMKSGCYLTLLINSICQAVLHSIACARLGWDPRWLEFFCVGDDTIQREVPDIELYVRTLAELGAIVKEWKVDDELEFCGHRMRNLALVPAYTPKHVFKILHTPTEQLAEMLQAYQWMYAMDDGMWDWITRALVKLAPHYSRHRRVAYSMLQDLT